MSSKSSKVSHLTRVSSNEKRAQSSEAKLAATNPHQIKTNGGESQIWRKRATFPQQALLLLLVSVSAF